MTVLNLTPTELTPGGGNPTDLTSLLAVGVLGGDTAITFNNTGEEVIYVQVTAATTVTSDIGTTVQGQSVDPEVYDLTTAGIYMFGPYPSQYDEEGSNVVEIDFGTPASVSGVAIVQQPGVI